MPPVTSLLLAGCSATHLLHPDWEFRWAVIAVPGPNTSTIQNVTTVALTSAPEGVGDAAMLAVVPGPHPQGGSYQVTVTATYTGPVPAGPVVREASMEVPILQPPSRAPKFIGPDAVEVLVVLATGLGPSRGIGMHRGPTVSSMPQHAAASDSMLQQLKMGVGGVFTACPSGVWYIDPRTDASHCFFGRLFLCNVLSHSITFIFIVCGLTCQVLRTNLREGTEGLPGARQAICSGRLLEASGCICGSLVHKTRKALRSCIACHMPLGCHQRALH